MILTSANAQIEEEQIIWEAKVGEVELREFSIKA